MVFPCPEMRVCNGKEGRKANAGSEQNGFAVFVNGEVTTKDDFFQDGGGQHGCQKPCGDDGLLGVISECPLQKRLQKNEHEATDYSDPKSFGWARSGAGKGSWVRFSGLME